MGFAGEGRVGFYPLCKFMQAGICAAFQTRSCKNWGGADAISSDEMDQATKSAFFFPESASLSVDATESDRCVSLLIIDP